MKSILKNISTKNVIKDPFPHLDIVDALPENIYECMVNELPKTEVLDEYFKNSKSHTSAVSISKDILSELNLKTPYIDEFNQIHSGEDFKNDILNLFRDYISECFPDLKFHLLNSNEAELSINPKKTVVSELNKENKTFIRGPHLDDPAEIGVFLYYINRRENNIKGGDLNLYEYNTRFRGFRRDIWWDERELKSNHVKKLKQLNIKVIDLYFYLMVSIVFIAYHLWIHFLMATE